jgi:acetyl esterase/lipase
MNAARFPLHFQVAATALLIALSAGCSGGHPHQAATAAASTASAGAGTARQLSFRSGPDTLPATLLSPGHAGREVPGALIISGSGPTDRDGNDRQLPHLDTNRNFARALSGDGVASLRYDKLGSGAAGIGAHPDPGDVDFDLFAQEALDAYRTLASQPGIDPHRLVVVGHSEGGLFALWLADHLKGTPEAPRMLVLAAPLGRRYLDVLARQLTDQYRQAQAAGQLPAKDAAARIADLHRVIVTLRATGKPPAHLVDPVVAAALNPVNAAFLAQADRLDPAELARQLGPSLPVLVLRGTKDVQVDSGDVDHLMQGLAAGRSAVRADIPDADHLFKVVTGTPNPAVDYANAGRPFAPQVAPRLASFLAPLLS